MKPSFENLAGTEPCTVAESPIWDGETRMLYWVDIIGKSVFRSDMSGAPATVWKTEDFPTAIALTSVPDRAILAMAGGVCDLDFRLGKTELLCAPDGMAGNRLNEGKCDPQGRFWVGSMQTNLNPDGSGRDMDRNSGALFRIDGSYGVSRQSEHEFGITNTLAWSPDHRTLYFGDTIRNVIFAYDFDPDDGVVGARSVLIEGYARGLPDGSAIDADGCLWNARFGGGVVIRVTPDGHIDRKIEVPVTNPTSCAFAGADKRLLVVTSATFTLSTSQLEANPVEGSVLVAEADISGLPDYRFRSAD